MANSLRRKNAVVAARSRSPFSDQSLLNRRAWRDLAADTSGASAVEYALLAGFVAVGLAGGLGALVDLAALLFDIIGDAVADAADTFLED